MNLALFMPSSLDARHAVLCVLHQRLRIISDIHIVSFVPYTRLPLANVVISPSGRAVQSLHHHSVPEQAPLFITIVYCVGD